MNQQKKLWEPTDAFIRDSNLKKFEAWLHEHKGLSFDNYAELWSWSVADVGNFWECIWQYFDVIGHTPYATACSSDEMPGVKWYSVRTRKAILVIVPEHSWHGGGSRLRLRPFL